MPREAMAHQEDDAPEEKDGRDCMRQVEDFMQVLSRGIMALMDDTRQAGKSCLRMAGHAYYPIKEAALLGQDHCRGIRAVDPRKERVMRPVGGVVATFRYGM
eukprot:CAMPEP_0175632396 /NCGR_PEP_ID=MMETSP0097-20121207/90_1 /TAXON_ID=311494 /ORGANISM="Alexandrium monilatum, Strain CCMP3105" /LENGTH=101 /DNA_ID=CAMNT_0016937873 /DNA_START=11 /DNA_END=316 /DNA_ORIENTATION=+